MELKVLEGKERLEINPLSDSPLSNPKDDKFNRGNFSKKISDVLSKRNDKSSIVIGIYGSWGEGKTTVLDFIRYYLKLDDNIITVNFNPWRYENEDKMLGYFYKDLAEAIGKKEKSFLQKMSIFTKNSITTVSTILNKKEIGELLSGVIPTQTIEKVKETVEKHLSKIEKKVVVFVDDIDRLEKDEIQTVFKIVKLNAQISNVSYVLAFDELIVANALKEKFIDGRAYLEKIIQVPLELPKARREDLLNICLESISEAFTNEGIIIDNDTSRKIDFNFRKLFQYDIENPRQIARLVNSFSFSNSVLKGEVDTHDLLVLEATKIFSPETYELVKNNKELFLPTLYEGSKLGERYNAKDKDRFEDFIANLDLKKKELSLNVIKLLFPNMSYLYTETNGERHLWKDIKKQKTINNPNYIDKYFTYGVPYDDISDAVIDQFIDAVEENDLESMQYFLRLTDNKGIVFIDKLISRVDQIIEEKKYTVICELIYLNSQFLLRKNRNYQDLCTRALELICEFLAELTKDESTLLLETLLIKFKHERSLNLNFIDTYWFYIQNDYRFIEVNKLGIQKELILKYIKENCLDDNTWLLNEKNLNSRLADFSKIHREQIQEVVNAKLKNLEGFAEKLVLYYPCKENDNGMTKYIEHLNEFCDISIIKRRLEERDGFLEDKKDPKEGDEDLLRLYNFYKWLKANAEVN